jgi:cell shape-determining protein MreC
MGRTQRSNRHRAQALPKRKIKTRNEIEELREENRRLRELEQIPVDFTRSLRA